MHKTIAASFLIVGFLAFSSFTNAGLTAEQVLNKAEQKLAAATTTAVLDITVQRPKWTKTMQLKTWNKGTDYALAYILSPEKDKGTIYLKNKNDVWNYLPKIKKTVKLPATLLSQNWMGTDLSTDDLVKLSKLTEDYSAKLIAEKSINGRLCYGIQLDPKPTADVLWGRLVMYIDKQHYVQLKTTFYDEDLEAVNTLIGSDLKSFGGKTFASKLVMLPSGKNGSKTTVVYKSLKFNQPLSTSFFAKENLAKVRP